jgi:hypothetical protein
MLLSLDGNIFFELNGVRYESGSTIIVTEVEASTISTGLLNPDASLVCMTSEVNTECCRGRDGGNVGEWVFPDGSVVPRSQNHRNGDFSRSGFAQQVRLNRRNDAMGPLGTYSCVVPPMSGCGSTMHMANITIGMSDQVIFSGDRTPGCTPRTTITCSSHSNL